MKTKKIIIILICWASALQIFAQDTKPSTVSNDDAEFNTIFHKGDGTRNIPLGYFIEGTAGYSHFGHKSVFLPGMSMGIILDHHWTIGMTGSFIVFPQGSYHHHGESDSVNADTVKHHGTSRGGYGGLLLEYTLFPRSKIHVSFPLIIGAGSVFHNQAVPADSVHSQPAWSHYFSHGESFFVLEPGVKLELNVIKKMRVGLGISYRYSPEHNRQVTSPDVINQFTARLSVRFGKF